MSIARVYRRLGPQNHGRDDVRTLTALSEVGAIIAPPVPAFHAKPASWTTWSSTLSAAACSICSTSITIASWRARCAETPSVVAAQDRSLTFHRTRGKTSHMQAERRLAETAPLSGRNCPVSRRIVKAKGDASMAGDSSGTSANGCPTQGPRWSPRDASRRKVDGSDIPNFPSDRSSS